jgi:hypothetical protein
MGWIGSAI